MLFVLYRGLMSISGPLLRWHLKRRVTRGKEDPARLGERFGLASTPRPDGKVLWIHAASVGESLSVLPLLEALLAAHPAWSVVMTTGTMTSAQLMADRLPPRAYHQFVPLDHPKAAQRFLDHWSPSVVLWVESELWPVLLQEIARRHIPLALINGRLSARSLARWHWLPGAERALFGGFHLVLAQTNSNAARFRALGVHTVQCLGNLKTAAPPLPVDPQALEALHQEIGDRPCWLAASTQPGEEEEVWAVHRRLSAALPTLLTVILPRHPERGPALAETLRHAGARVARRSAADPVGPETQVYLADTLGETGLFYRLCPVVFMGKSLWGQRGGQNPLEPVRLGAAVLFGPHMDNFVEAKEDLLAASAALCVTDSEDLCHRLTQLLTDPAARHALGQAGQAVTEDQGEILPRILAALAPLFQEPSP